MICPDDGQPCTMDHSAECAAACHSHAEQRRGLPIQRRRRNDEEAQTEMAMAWHDLSPEEQADFDHGFNDFNDDGPPW